MSSLLLERDLRESEEDSEVRTLARARTLTVLERMDPSRKRAVIQFLYEADLVLRNEGSQPITKPIISLEGADLEGADLRAAVMWFVDLSEADLSGAILHDAELPGATLKETDLRKADLSDDDLNDANLRKADLSAQDPKQQLEAAKSLKGATMPNGQKYEDWLKSKDRAEDGENA
jgi:uncharacterized protein YjbI with pentapeptide repeats